MTSRIQTLVLSQSEANRQRLTEMLRTQLRASIVGAVDSTETVFAYLELFDIHLVVLDLDALTPDAFQATRKIRYHWPGVTRIALSSTTEHEDDCLIAGVDVFVSKDYLPFTLV